MSDNRNMILALVLSAIILVTWELFFANRYVGQVPPTPVRETVEARPTAPEAGIPTAPGTPGTPAQPTLAPIGRDTILADMPRVEILTPRLRGSISLAGGRIDDLVLTDYREHLDPDSDNIVLLSPKGITGAYFAEFGWVAAGDVDLPGPDTQWSASADKLSPDEPLVLTWDNGAGLLFSRTIAIDGDYMFAVTQTVENKSGQAVTFYPYGLISRRGTPEVTGFVILHEGLLGVLDGTLTEVDYDDLQETGTIEQDTVGGWIGITDKYWLTALVPDQGADIHSRFRYSLDEGTDKYQADFRGGPMVAEPGKRIAFESHFFAGAKEVELLDRYESGFGILHFDKAIDFGWFYFLTKPMFYVLIYINRLVGNFGIAILLLTVLVKAIFFPLANKSYRAMSKMKKLQPEMLKLRERFGEDKVRLNKEMMDLYKREKANPASGCLPMIIQIPVFFALYKVLFVTIEMRHAPFFGWIVDLSAPDPLYVVTLFGLLDFTPPQFLMIGIWPLFMGITMFVQQRLNPQPADPVQAKIFLFMPIMFTFLLGRFPAGLVIYWAWNNILSIVQQRAIMHRMGVT